VISLSITSLNATAPLQKLGVEAGSRPSAFIDLAMRLKEFDDIQTGKNVPIDAAGWPMR